MASSRQNNLNNITVLNITNTNRSHFRLFVVSGNPSKTKHSLHCQHAFLSALREIHCHGLSRTMARHATE